MTRFRWRRTVAPALLPLCLGSLLIAQEAGEQAPDPNAAPAQSAADQVPAAQDEEELSRFDEMELPEAEELLSGRRRDWIVLQDGRVLVVEPVYPRPNTLAQIQAERDAIMADPKRRYSAEGKQRLNDLVRLSVFLPGDVASIEYQVETVEVREIVHHEDLMLRRVDRLVEQGQTREAFELLFVVARTDPSWPGLDERQLRLIAADIDRLLDEGKGESALSLVESLYEREPVPGVADDLLGRAADVLVEGALQVEDFRQARFAVARIRQVDPRHRAVSQWTSRLAELARSIRGEAERASAAGDDALAAVLIDRAAQAWPRLDGLRPVHARLTERHQRLVVGVPRLAPATSLALPTAAEARVRRLTTADLFEVDGFEGVPAYRSIYFERWEPTDLGRRARFELRPALPAWAARPALTSSEAVALLGGRLRSSGPGFDARFADLVDTLRPLGPYEFEVVFRRIPLRAEAALARSPLAADVARPTDGLFRRFVETARSGDRVTYRRANGGESGTERRLAEVVEVTFPSYETAAQAFDRGELRMLADVPAWDVPRLREDKRFVVTKLALPATHLLQFHPASEPFKSTELRRAVAASADASESLRLVAGAGADEFGRLVTAPFPSTHLGYDPLVAPRAPDLPLALALVLAAEKRFGGTLPEVVFAAPAESPARQVAESLVSAWKRIGLPVKLVSFDELGPEDRWDVAYRELTVADPVSALAPLVTLDPSVEVTSLSDLPEWLRQRLLDLERAGDATTAHTVLRDLHRLLHADVRSVPLFEVDRFVATRGAIRGMPERPIAIYQNAERWVVPSEYPEETP